MGDFNCVANFDERISQQVCTNEILPMRGSTFNSGLHDIKFSRIFFTWTNNLAGASTVLSKIDKVIGNSLWDDVFPMAEVFFLPNDLFDYSPMLVCFFNNLEVRKPFCFCNH